MQWSVVPVIFLFLHKKAFVVVLIKILLRIEVLLMSTHNICFIPEISK